MALWRVHVELEDRPGRLGELATAVGAAGCNILSVHVVGEPTDRGSVTEKIVTNRHVEHALECEELRSLKGRAGAEENDFQSNSSTTSPAARMVVSRQPGANGDWTSW